MSEACGPVVAVRVRRARRAGILGCMAKGNGTVVLRVAVSEPPEDGKAHEAVCTLLAEAFGVPASADRIIHSAGARDKVVRVAGDAATLSARLATLMP